MRLLHKSRNCNMWKLCGPVIDMDDNRIDKLDATDFPVGTFNHATSYVGEKTGSSRVSYYCRCYIGCQGF